MKQKKSEQKEKVKKMLGYRSQGYSLSAIGGIFHLTRERIRQLIEKYKDEPEFKLLYKKINKTWKFLNRTP